MRCLVSKKFILFYSVFCLCAFFFFLNAGCTLRILFRILSSEERADVWPEIEINIAATCASTLEHYTHGVTRETRDVWTPLVTLILREIIALDDERVCQTTHCCVVLCCVVLCCVVLCCVPCSFF